MLQSTIRTTRFYRNPRIARALTEFGWVLELNEGVKKIYSDMVEYGLDEPEYRNSANAVTLILKNNIAERGTNKTSFNPSNDVLSDVLNDGLNESDRTLLDLIMRAPSETQSWYSEEAGFSIAKVQRIMKKLQEQGIIYRQGAKKKGFWKVKVEGLADKM